MSAASDLPPRTWRGWWLAWPKWARIGGLAALTMGALHVAVAVRFAFGLREDERIASLRQRGAILVYSWEQRPQRFPGDRLMMAGLMGRSGASVVHVEINRRSDTDLQSLISICPNVEQLVVDQVELPNRQLAALLSCRSLRDLSLKGCEFDDRELSVLQLLPRLRSLNLSVTPVTDESVQTLQTIKSLEYVDLTYTAISAEAFQVWSRHQPSTLRLVTNFARFPGQIPTIIRWSDGMGSIATPSVYELVVEGPLTDAVPARFSLPMELKPINQELLTRTLRLNRDGDYRFTLRIGENRSAPIEGRVEAGRIQKRGIEFHLPVTKQQALGESP